MDGKIVADWVVLTFAFALGLAVSSVAAMALGAPANTRAGFRPPFVNRDHLAMSLLITAFAGPVMLFNDAVEARGDGVIGPLFFVTCLAITGLWALAIGILATELAWRAGLLIT